MSGQSLDLRRSLLIVRRHIIVVGIIAVLGGLAGVAYSVMNPPQKSSNALVVLSNTNANTVGTQAVIATSNPVLAVAMSSVDPAISLQEFRSRIKVTTLTTGVLSITGSGKTAALAERTANAVAESYIQYVKTNFSAAGGVQTRLLPATAATGPSFVLRAILTGVLGLLIGTLVAAIGTLLVGRVDRRLRQRDDFADAIGVPVLTSIRVWHPANPARWTSLLEDYQPTASNTWRLLSALRFLEMMPRRERKARRSSITVLSLASDPRAAALGPHLAVTAAEYGIKTALVIGPSADASSIATLRVACGAAGATPRRSGNLRVWVADQGATTWHSDAQLTVVVTVLDGQRPNPGSAIKTDVTVIGVSSGSVTAEQLATVAVAASADSRQIEGILLADPDPADPTTGRIPQVARPARRIQPTRVAGASHRAERRVPDRD